MRRVLLLLMGFVPMLLFGFLMNRLIITAFYYVPGPYSLIGAGSLVVWFIFGILAMKLVGSKKTAVFYLNAPAFLVLLLLFVQELIVGVFWANQLGLATQFFYLPLMRFATALGVSALPFVRFSIIAAISFVLLLGCSYLGCVAAQRRMRRV